MKICPKGHGPQESLFCSECGTALVPAIKVIREVIENPQEQEELVLGAGDKPTCSCGQDLTGYYGKFCPQCGRRLKRTFR